MHIGTLIYVILSIYKRFSFFIGVKLNSSILNDLWKLLKEVEVIVLEKVVLVAAYQKLCTLVDFGLSVVEDFVAVGQRNLFIVYQVNQI